MRTSWLAAVLVGGLVVGWSLEAAAQTRVQGYMRKDGTYVEPYYRSAPDRTPTNNYSYPGNLNPYTGQQAPGGLQPLPPLPPLRPLR